MTLGRQWTAEIIIIIIMQVYRYRYSYKGSGVFSASCEQGSA